jgi:hypothetical protein
LLLFAIVTIAAATVSIAAATSAVASTAACNPVGTLTGTTVHFCGPARATLSAFPGVTFKGGTCTTKPNGNVVFTLKIGTRTSDATRNSGLRFFALSVTGSLTHPTGGVVVAYSAGKEWIGAGTSLRGSRTSGSFTAAGAKGKVSGTYHC